MGLAQIGEFSFIIASLGLTLKVTSNFLYPIAVAVSVITTLLTPYLIKSADGLVSWFDARAPKPLVDYLETLYELDRGRAARRKDSLAGKLIRKWTFQLVLNTALVSGIFLMAAFVARGRFAWAFPGDCPSPREPGDAILWLWRHGSEPAVVYRHGAQAGGHGNVDRGFERQPEQGRRRHPQSARVGGEKCFSGGTPGHGSAGICPERPVLAARGNLYRFDRSCHSHRRPVLAIFHQGLFPGPDSAQGNIRATLPIPPSRSSTGNSSTLESVRPVNRADRTSFAGFGKLIRELRLRTVYRRKHRRHSTRGRQASSIPAPTRSCFPATRVLLLGTSRVLAAGSKALRETKQSRGRKMS